MRIWLANHYAVPNNIAGITRHYELAYEWATKNKADVVLWNTNFVHPRRTYVTPEEKKGFDQPDNLELTWLWSFPHKKNDVRRMMNMASFTVNFFLRALFRKKPDIMVGSSPHIFTPFAACILAKLKRVPFIVEIRDLWPDSLTEMGGLKNKFLIRLLSWIEAYLYKHADKIVVLTEYQRKFIHEKKGIPLEKIELIPNGIVVGSWEKDPSRRAEYKRKMGIPEDHFVAIYTGAHGPANALHHVVKAGRYLPKDVSIVLIGDGPEKENLIKLKKEEGLENVHFLDPVPKSEIFNYTEAADCGIISLSDNFVFRGARPNKLFDYSFVGKPIITSVDGEIREIVEKNEIGFFAGTENPKGIAEAIMRARQLTPEQLEKIAENGLRYIDREGNRQKLAQKYYKIMEDLIEESSVKEETSPAS